MQKTMEYDFVIRLIHSGFEKQVNHEPWNASNNPLTSHPLQIADGEAPLAVDNRMQR